MQKFIRQFLKYFFIVIAAYHIIVTVLSYGMDIGLSQSNISIIRDAIWICFVILIAIRSDDGIKGYWKKWKNVRITFGILILFSLGISYLKGTSLSNMMIGIKYGFYFLVIFLTASFVGYVGIKKFNAKDYYRVQYLLIGILFAGFARQIMKIGKPELFMNIGYGSLDDFAYGEKPPLYYLTGYEGTMRWQGIFAGPNNYGYFLVAFLPLVLLIGGGSWQSVKNFFRHPRANLHFLFTIFWLVAIGMTLSRSAILGTAVIFAFLAKDWIKAHKKLSIGIFAAIIAGLVGLSFLKPESTIGHFNASFSYVGEIINHPLGHGLGTSGPAVHHEGTMLPENYFMQIMLDIGSVGFILWCAVIFMILIIFKSIEKDFKTGKYSGEDSAAYLQWQRLLLGRLVLLTMGLFLHVFEDSMVNYLFFCIFGMLSGYLSKFYKPENNAKFADVLKKDELSNVKSK